MHTAVQDVSCTLQYAAFITLRPFPDRVRFYLVYSHNDNVSTGLAAVLVLVFHSCTT